MILLITALCLTCVILIAWGFTGFNRCLRFASLFAMSMAGFAIPQVVGLYNNKTLPDGALEMFVIMATLCLVCALAGDAWGHAHPGTRLRQIGDYDARRVIEATLILNVFALVTAMILQL